MRKIDSGWGVRLLIYLCRERWWERKEGVNGKKEEGWVSLQRERGSREEERHILFNFF